MGLVSGHNVNGINFAYGSRTVQVDGLPRLNFWSPPPSSTDVCPLNDRFRERQPVLRQRGQTENFEIIYRTKSCELGVIDRDYRSLCPAPTRARLRVAQETAMTPQR